MPKSTGTGISGPLLVILALLSTVAPFAIDIYLPVFTDLAEDLHTNAPSVQLTLTAFLAGLAVGQLCIGSLSDRFGRRRPLLSATALATAVTVMCALAPNIWVLVLMRFLQGVAGSAGLVIGRAVVADRTRGPATARVFTLFASIGGIAPVIAPLIGGVLAPAGWRTEFWALSGIFGLMFLGALTAVPESLPAQRRHTGGLRESGRVMRALVTERGYLGYALSFALAFAGLMSYISASPFVVEKVLGLSTAAYTVDFALNALGMMIAGAVSSRLTGRFRPRSILRFGHGAILVFGAVLLALSIVDAPAVVVLPVLFLLVGSFPLTMGTAAALAVGRARHAAGTASALMGALQFTLGALVSPVVGLGGEGTGTPMAVMVVTCIGLAALMRRLGDTATPMETEAERFDTDMTAPTEELATA